MATLEIRERIPLRGLTTLQVGGPARFFADVCSEGELLEAVRFAQREMLPLTAIGGGSNLLVMDAGYPGVVVRMAIAGAMEVRELGRTTEYTVPAGVDWDAFVLATCNAGLSGVECLAGIPGLTGGTPVQNVGAYGQEVADTIVRVRAYDRMSGQFAVIDRAGCDFAYRSSMFNTRERGRYLITAATFALERGKLPEMRYADLRRHFGEGARPTPLETYHAVRAIRRGKGMLLVDGDPDSRSAGSFFKNPVVGKELFDRIAGEWASCGKEVPHWPVGDRGMVKLPAAWLVEQAGFGKGFTLGEAGISSRHTLALINRTGHASFADMVRLRDLIRDGVRGRFGVELEQEPIVLGGEERHAGDVSGRMED